MLIKMQRTRLHSDYLIFDNVESVNYETQPKTFLNPSERDDFVAAEQNEGVGQLDFWYAFEPQSGSKSDLSTYRGLNKISFYDKNLQVAKTLYFDGEMFICNDDGKTIQRINRT